MTINQNNRYNSKMWTAIPLSQLGTWDGNCIYKIKDGSRRCKLSAGGDTDVRRFGNRNELIAKVSRGVSLTRQEKSELARGLCCLRWHSTKNIAQEICEIWSRVPATVLLPLPSQQSEIQRLKAENKMLATRLQSAKAMEKHYYESWIGTFPQFKSLRTQIEELKKILEENRQVEEVSEDGNEFLTTKFGIRRNRVLPKGTFGVPAVTAVSCSYPNLINCLTCRPGNFYTRNPRKAHHHVQVQNTGQPRNNQLILLGRLRLPFTRLHSRQHILSEKGILRLIHPSPQCVQL